VDLNNLGGRILDNLSLYARPQPYVIRSDITVMPDATLHIYPDVVMEFAPNVGILVLGTLKAIGAPGHEIIMRPIREKNDVPTTRKRSANSESIRLCKEENCTNATNEGESCDKLIDNVIIIEPQRLRA
jgi:hypothetical protein